MSSFAAELQALLRYTDANRLLGLRMAPADAIARNLVVQRLHGREALSECGALTLECLGVDASIEAKSLLGRRVSVSLRGATGIARWFHGVVTQVVPGAADGGRRHYRLELRPLLALLEVPRTSAIYQEQRVPDIIEAELLRWRGRIPDLKWRFDLFADYPSRSYTVAYAETPLAFIERLCAEEGIGYRFEHPAPDEGEVGESIVVFFDHSVTLPSNAQARTRFHAVAGTQGEDTVDFWQGERGLVPGAVAMTSWAYRSAEVMSAGIDTHHQHGFATGLLQGMEDFAPQTDFYASGHGDLQRYARLRIEAYEAAAKVFHGAGSVRSFVAGTATELHGHHDIGHGTDECTLLLLSVEHDACNNLPAGLGDDGHEPGYRNRFTAIRQTVPWRPPFHAHRRPQRTAPGLQTAVVCGAEGREIDVDDQGRILVRFHWDRQARNSCRLRVANALSGEHWGMQTLPRIGQEVLVDFIEGDIDRPVVVGALHNGRHPPPHFSGVGSLPANHALSGIQTRELGGGSGFGELLFDDTAGQLRTRLSSEHAATQLNQGWLATPRTDGQAQARGEGFELRSDAAGALRAGQGMLLSAFGRLKARAGQLSRDETLHLMDECVQLFRQLGDYAAQHRGGSSDPSAHDKMQSALASWENGSNTAADVSPRGGAPMIAITAPEGVHLSSPQSVLTHAGRTVDTVALQHLQFASGEQTTLNAGQGLSLFAQSGGARLIAHQGLLQLQSQHDNTEIHAARDLKLGASAGKLHAMAADEILLSVAGGAYIKLSGGNVEIGAPGVIRMRAASHDWSGPATRGVDLPSFDKDDLGRTPQLLRVTDGAVVPGVRFETLRADGSSDSGQVDAQGRATTTGSSAFEQVMTRFLEEPDT